ncbi:MAG: helix-turn-helix transcriptional regulator [Alphaproteobacteria bacterium]|nr:helix-turn-helix transcriptional regulator [Alphaproteobacteria bacterium]
MNERTTIKKSALEYFFVANPLFIKLCKPLHDIGIRDYYFIKCHEDGTYLAYSSRRELMEIHIQTIRHQSQFFMDSVPIIPNSQVQFSLTGDIHQFDFKSDTTLGLFWDYGYWNTFMFYKIINSNLLEGWGFSLGNNFLDPLGFFLKNRELLEKFVHYFDITGKDLKNTSNKNKLAIYDDNFSFFNRSPETKNDAILLDFLHKVRLNKLSINHEGEDIHFTKRQCECLYYLSQHHSAKEIGQLLDLSYRSVETYIQTVKNKIRVSSKSDLLKFIHQHELSQKLELVKRVASQ